MDACALAIASGDAEEERVVDELVHQLAGAYDGACALLIRSSAVGQLERRALSATDPSRVAQLGASVDAVLARQPTSMSKTFAASPFVLPPLGDVAPERLDRDEPLFAELAHASQAHGLIAARVATPSTVGVLVLLCLAAGAPLDDDDVLLVQSVATHTALALTVGGERRRRAPALPPSPSSSSLAGRIVDALPAMVAYWDADLVCRFANRAYHSWFGVPPEAVIGCYMPTFLGRLFSLNQPFVEGALRGETQEFERTIPNPTGGPPRCSQALYIPDVGPDGVRGFSVLVVDITHRKNTEVALARAKEAADRVNRELESFSYSVAHDLRAPLRAIGGFGGLLASSVAVRGDPCATEWLSEICESAVSMGKLIDGLLLLSGVTRRALVRTRVDLSALVLQTAARLEAAFPERSVELVVPPGIYADADATLAAVLIDNLVGNAWKFTSKRVDAVIELGVGERDGVAMFYIRDNGAGFDEAYSAQLFAPFRRLHAPSEYPGMGIGLATVERVVRHHGGRLSATGAVGEGATFVWSLSSADGESGEAGGSRASDSPA